MPCEGDLIGEQSSGLLQQLAGRARERRHPPASQAPRSRSAGRRSHHSPPPGARTPGLQRRRGRRFHSETKGRERHWPRATAARRSRGRSHGSSAPTREAPTVADSQSVLGRRGRASRLPGRCCSHSPTSKSCPFWRDIRPIDTITRDVPRPSSARQLGDALRPHRVEVLEVDRNADRRRRSRDPVVPPLRDLVIAVGDEPGSSAARMALPGEDSWPHQSRAGELDRPGMRLIDERDLLGDATTSRQHACHKRMHVHDVRPDALDDGPDVTRGA